MSISTGADLFEVLRHGQFLGESQLEELGRNRLLRFTNARGLARELVRRGWLTPYQVNRLVQGHGDELVLGSYRLLEPLGEGYLGRVFKARDVRMGRVVALKIIHPERLATPQVVQRLDRAAGAASQLAHPNIAHALGAGQMDGHLVIASEFIDGTDLETLVHRGGPLPVAEACAYARQAALALHHAHGRGVCHRNVKPRNLLVSGGPGVVKVVDFGLAGFENESGPGQPMLARVGDSLGTIDFIAPEQVTHPTAADSRSDIFGLGCTLFYLLTAQLPFPGARMMDRVLARLAGKAAAVRSLRPEVTEALEGVLARMMARDPAQRYATAAEVADALEPFTQEPEATPVPAEPRGQARIKANGPARPLSPAPRHRRGSPERVPPRSVKKGDAIEVADGAFPPPPPPPKDRGPWLVGLGAAGMLVLIAVAVGAGWFTRGPHQHASLKSQAVRGEERRPTSPAARKKPANRAEKTVARAEPKKRPGKTEPKSEPRGEPRPEPKDEPSPEDQPRPEGKARPTPKPDPVIKPRPAPEPEPKPEPKAEPKAEPKPEPKAEPEPEPKPEPKAEPKPQPKPRPTPVKGRRKLPVPDRAAQAKAEALIKDVFQAEYAKKGPLDMKALAAKLLQQGLDTRDDLQARFVLFREAGDLAAQAGDLKTAFAVVDKLASEYAVDALLLKAAFLTTAGGAARTSAAHQVVAEAALPLVDAAVNADRYDVALRLATVADAAAKHCPSARLSLRIESRTREVREMEKEYRRIKPLADALAGAGDVNKADMTAADCLALGKFLCFMKGQWDAGLPLLARGGDESLKALVESDLARPAAAAAQVKLGDRWWALAEKAGGVARRQLRLRACHWYRQPADEQLQGLTRTKVERRIKIAGD
jgi:serine/threonine protein kinase